MSSSELPGAMLPEAPFRGAEPFRFIDRPIFFERQLETRLLLREIVIYRGVLLYGDSGAGKSSLINAGLIPAALDEGFTPDRIRLKNLRGAEIVIERISLREDGSPPFITSSLVDIPGDADRVVLSIADFKKKLKSFSGDHYPLLIFDQFEEFATLFEEALKPEDVPEAKRNQEAILGLLVDLLRDRQLKVKLLFSFREDYLAKLTKLFTLSPELQQQYVRLTSPTTEALPEIIGGPFKSKQLGDHFARLPNGTIFSDNLISRLEKDFRGRSPTGILNLTEIQLACLELWSSKNPEELYAKENVGGLLRLFLERAVARLEERKLKEQGVALLSFMVTSFGTRNVISEFDLLGQVRGSGNFTDAQLHEALDLLVKESKLVRRVILRDAPHYEIVSEFFAPWIAERRREREKLRAERESQFNERALRLRKLTVFSMAIAGVLLSIALGWALYAQYRAGAVAKANADLLQLVAEEKQLRSKATELEMQSREAAEKAAEAKTKLIEAQMRTQLALRQAQEAEARASLLVPEQNRRRLKALSNRVAELETERDDLLTQLEDKETQIKTLSNLVNSLKTPPSAGAGNQNAPPYQSRELPRKDKQSRRSNMLLGSTMLEVAVGLFFIYLLMSLVCCAAAEIIAAFLKLRARSLRDGMDGLLGGDSDLINKLYAHPLIRSLLGSRPSMPSYIPSGVFAMALLDILIPARLGEASSIHDVFEGLAAHPNPELRHSLLPMIQGARNFAEIIPSIEQWYNHAMNRVSSNYRLRIGWRVLILAGCLSVSLNLDSINIANSIFREDVTRASVLAAAESYAQNSSPTRRASAAPEPGPATQSTYPAGQPTYPTGATPTASPAGSPIGVPSSDLESKSNENQERLTLRNEVNELGQTLRLPIGWSGTQLPLPVNGWILKVIGLLLTTLIVSLGAPLLFDILNKFAFVRWTIKPPDSNDSVIVHRAAD
jgi:hypothetical protein